MERPLDGLWIINADAKTVFASDHMAEILGTTPAEMKGEHSFDYVFPEDVAAAQRLFESKKRGDPAPFHFRLRRKDGSPVWVHVQATPMFNAAGVFTGIVGTFTISETTRPKF
jgi:PAS domain S-box-containing protein